MVRKAKQDIEKQQACANNGVENNVIKNNVIKSSVIESSVIKSNVNVISNVNNLSNLPVNQGLHVMQSSETLAGIVPADINAQHYSRCGGALRTAREKSSLTVQDIASRLRLSPKQILAIEADNFATLPESTIVRGFIRNYAKLLKIDVEPLLDAYKVIVPEKSPYAFSVKPDTSVRVSNYEKPKTGRYIWAGFLLILGVSAWLFYQHYIQKPSPSSPSASIESSINNGSETNGSDPNSTGVLPNTALPQPALPVAERAAETAAIELSLPPAVASSTNINPAIPATQPAPLASLPATSTPSLSDNVQSNTGSSPTSSPNTTGSPNSSTALPPLNAPAAVLNTVPNTAQAALTGVAKIEFVANQETWVTVTDNTGKKVYNKSIFAGSRESIDIIPPLTVVIGNAGGTTLSMNGKTVDLAPHTRGNVARIKLD